MDYTISELTQELQRSRPVVEKWCKRQGFKSTIKVVNNRELKAYIISDRQLQELKHALELESGYEPEEEVIEAHFESGSENTGFHSPGGNSDVIEFANKYIADMKQLTEQLRSESNRAVGYEKEVKLLTTLDNSKDDEINRLRAENKELNKRVALLEKEIDDLKSRKFWQLKAF